MLAASYANEPPCAEAFLVAAVAIVKVYCQGIHYLIWSCWETAFPGNGWNRSPKSFINGIYCFIPLLFCSIRLTKKTSTLTRFVLVPGVFPTRGYLPRISSIQREPGGTERGHTCFWLEDSLSLLLLVLLPSNWWTAVCLRPLFRSFAWIAGCQQHQLHGAKNNIL